MTFGPRPSEPRRAVVLPKTGDTVRVVSGRYRGAVGRLTSIERVASPTGGHVVLACVRRPRAGDTIVFVTDLETVDVP